MYQYFFSMFYIKVPLYTTLKLLLFLILQLSEFKNVNDKLWFDFFFLLVQMHHVWYEDDRQRWATETNIKIKPAGRGRWFSGLEVKKQADKTWQFLHSSAEQERLLQLLKQRSKVSLFMWWLFVDICCEVSIITVEFNLRLIKQILFVVVRQVGPFSLNRFMSPQQVVYMDSQGVVCGQHRFAQAEMQT